MIRCGGGGYTSPFLCLKSVFFDAGYSGGYSKWIFTFIELDIQNRVLAVCDTDMLKYHNFKNTPCFLFDSPPKNLSFFTFYFLNSPISVPLCPYIMVGRGLLGRGDIMGDDRGTLRFPSPVYGNSKSAYPTFAVPEMGASDTCFSFSIVICRIRSSKRPISLSCSLMISSFSLIKARREDSSVVCVVVDDVL